ncbi:MAG TPA: HlyD family efflux transporter periplasmic adaptor subunit [Xanthobacteraceae bacterium]|nr:HlyD family efflux transporter periplasmic adaptor subunit [Xanthobacteraceae bacterium]
MHRGRQTVAGLMLAGAVATIAALVLPAELSAQSASFSAPGRVEGAGPTLSIGAAATGTVSEVLVHEASRVHAGQTLLKLDCRSIEGDMHSREAQLAAAQANFERVRNGPRPDEVKVGEAVVGYSQARAEEAQKTLDRTEDLKEGVTVTTARVLEVQRDARIAAAQLEEARARLSLLRAGSREEDIRQAEALRNAAAAEVESLRARVDQCTVRAPVDGVVLDVLANQGQYLSLAVPEPLLHIVPDGQLRVRAEIELRDWAHVCILQNATVAAEGFTSATIRGHVGSISPTVTARSLPAVSSDSGGKDVVPVTLELARGGPALPIGLPVTVHFEACPSKT